MIHAEAERLLAAGAVLGDLEPGEQAAYDAHRAGCPACRALEVELDDVLADLALVVPDRLPPPDLLQGIRAAIGAAPASTSRGAAGAGPMALEPSIARAGAPGDAVVPGAPRPGTDATAAAAPAGGAASVVVPFDRAARRSQRLLAASLGLAAVLAIVAVGLGARATGLQRDLETANAQVTALRESVATAGTAMTTAMNPAHVTVALHAEALAPAANAAVMYVPGSTSSWIVADDLPATPAGQGYQLWYADAAGVHGLQTVAFDGKGPFMAPIDADLSNASAVMITLEPAGGATGEPGPQVVFGEL